MIPKIILAVAFFLSVFVLPWWVAVLIATAYLSEGGNMFVVILGGFLLDELYGAPIVSLHGFAYVYTLLTLILALATAYLRRALFE